eukprot:GHVL01000552.1.p1 GENE.GHVL01000552.1~~GHVL01000552.1.p1  ORF type:complete len:475 (+),score=122.97 GHVL01000552.1:76-1500(+)
MSVLLETTLGDITIDLEYKKCPKSCQNFIWLCKMKYYNNNLFFRIEKDFIAVAGDPTNTGRESRSVFGHLYGDQANYFESEIKSDLRHDRIGTIGMANDKIENNGSQFYITLRDKVDYLDEKHTVFGYIAAGEGETSVDVVDKFNNLVLDDEFKPIQPVRIMHTNILFDPFEASEPKRLHDLIPSHSPEVIRDVLYDQQLSEIDSKQLMKKIATAEASSRAVALEMMGDLPDADTKPPENVLFICKLNPYTEDSDLEIIFSKYGTINSCEIIRDWKTGDSLQYAFIEFDNVKSAEQAYFKMQDILVDDRRIHVDFSQSVSKQWNKFRRLGAKATKMDAKMAEESSKNAKSGEKDKKREDVNFSKIGFVFEKREKQNVRKKEDKKESRKYEDKKYEKSDDRKSDDRKFNDRKSDDRKSDDRKSDRKSDDRKSDRKSDDRKSDDRKSNRKSDDKVDRRRERRSRSRREERKRNRSR